MFRATISIYKYILQRKNKQISNTTAAMLQLECFCYFWTISVECTLQTCMIRLKYTLLTESSLFYSKKLHFNSIRYLPKRIPGSNKPCQNDCRYCKVTVKCKEKNTKQLKAKSNFNNECEQKRFGIIKCGYFFHPQK